MILSRFHEVDRFFIWVEETRALLSILRWEPPITKPVPPYSDQSVLVWLWMPIIKLHPMDQQHNNMWWFHINFHPAHPYIFWVYLSISMSISEYINEYIWVCQWVYLSISMRISEHINIYNDIFISEYINLSISTNISEYINEYIWVYQWVFLSISMSISEYINKYIWVYQ